MVKPVIVIGAGICGISTAIWLQRSNFEVLLLDKAIIAISSSENTKGINLHSAGNVAK